MQKAATYPPTPDTQSSKKEFTRWILEPSASWLKLLTDADIEIELLPSRLETNLAENCIKIQEELSKEG